MTTAARQYSLALAPPPARLTRQDFVVAESNAAALDTLLSWSKAAEPLLVIAGPPGSGKTHLLSILSETYGAADQEPGAIGLSIVDDAENMSPGAILSFVERARETGMRLAIAGAGDPIAWAQGLRDLETRLGAGARIELEDPDEALLRAVILKLLRDRQLRAGRGLAAYATARLPKTFAAARAFIGAVDAASIAGGVPVGIRLARAVIANLSEEPQHA